MKARSWSRWPAYSDACRRDVRALLRDGTRLTAYQANPKVGPGPRAGSWAWRLERLAERLYPGFQAIACANATLGLTAALKALDLPPGAEVATTAFTFSATAAAIMHADLEPGFYDVHSETMTLDPSHGWRLGTPRAVVPVDLFGRVCPTPNWSIPCVEDACQAVGSRQIGQHADLAVFSFNGRKNVPAGEGGLILVKDADRAKWFRLWLSHAENFGVPWVGTNGHLNELSACVAYHGLKAVRVRNKIRQDRARLLNRLLGDPGEIESWRRERGLPSTWTKPELLIRVFPNPDDHAFYVYPLILHAGVDRDKLVKALTKLGVQSQPGYITPALHEYAAFQKCRRAPLPVTEELSRKTLLLLPTQITSETTEADVRWLAGRMRAAFTLIR